MNGLRSSLTSAALLLLASSMTQVASAEGNIIFEDNFVSETLKPVWHVAVEDRNRWGLVENDYLILLPKLDPVNIFSYKEELPESYRAVISLDSPPNSDWSRIELGIGDGEDWVSIWYSPYVYGTDWYGQNVVGPIVASPKKADGDVSAYVYDDLDKISERKKLFFSVTKEGVEYTMAFSTDGAYWHDIGTHSHLSLNGTIYFAYFYMDDWTNAASYPEAPIKIDRIYIQTLE
mgnify:CR=1 FL=1